MKTRKYLARSLSPPDSNGVDDAGLKAVFAFVVVLNEDGRGVVVGILPGCFVDREGVPARIKHDLRGKRGWEGML